MEFCVNQTDFFNNDYNIAGNQTYNGGVLRINHCFRNLFNLVPAIFLIIFTPLVIYDFRTSRNGPLHKKNPTTIRMFTCAFLILDVCLQICYLIVNSLINKDGKSQQQNMATPFGQFFSLSMLGLSLLLALFLIMNSLKYGLVSSGVLFNYWLLLAIFGAPQFRTTIETLIGQEEEDNFFCALYAIYYIVVIATLILSCFADKPKDMIITEKTCPEWYVSYLNRLIFWWFNPLANKGNKQDLTFDDLWELPERDKSQYLVKEFENIRTKQLSNYDRQKRKRTKVNLRAKDKTDETELLQPNSIEKPKSDEAKKDLNPPSIIWPLFITFKFTILGSFLCKVVYDILQFVPPLYLGLIIKFVENRQQPSWIGIGIAFAMFFTSLIQSMFLHQYFHMMLRFGMNIRTILTSLVYKKALLLSNEARKNRTIGEIVNLMTVDIQKLQDISMWIMFIWSAPLQISLSLYFLWKLLGPAIIAGIVCLATFIPINTGITIIMRNMQQRQMALKDERIKLLNEMLNGIRVLKLYAWEESIENRILEIRQKELKVLKKIAYMNAISSMLWSSAPFLVAVSTFATYLFIDPENNILSPEITFVALSYFNILRFPLAVFPFITSQIVQCNVSNKRLKTFLAEKEIEIVNNAIRNQNLSIAVNDGNFSWDLDGPLVLKDINLAVKKGSLVAIVGRIGSGKSSLLSAILGEAYRRSGIIGIDGRVAYVPQQAWIQNMTLKENVLFGAQMDQNKYDEVLDACALKQDLAALPGGDATEIGEKGINLSGGQKQRISLARAAYSDSDIYFLDDPLSAVDSHVGKHIFEKLIGTEKGILRDKTRILVTHGLSFLKYCDQIIVVKDGKISESGSYQDLLKDSGEFSNLIEEYLQKKGEEAEAEEVLEELGKIDPEKRAKLDRQISEMTSRSTNSPISRNASNEEENPETESTVRHRRHQQDSQNAQNGDIPTQTATTGEEKATMGNNKMKIIEKEEIFTGKVKFDVYLGYLQAVSYSICAFFFLIYIGSSILGVACNLWLAKWTDQAKEIQSGKNGTFSDETIERLSIFTVLGISQAFLIALGSIVMSFGMIYAGRKLHQMMLTNVLRNAMSWFDVTPLGRIMNRFGKDIYMVDFSIPSTLLAFFGNSIYGFLAIIIPILIIPWICPFILALICVYMFILDVDYLDNEIPRSFMSFLRAFFSSLETIIMICYATPQFIVIILPLAIFYGLVLRYYASTSRQLKRMESTTRSPIYSFFQESIQGASSIRAYNSVKRFVDESHRKVDKNSTCLFPLLVANRWRAVRLDLVGNAIVFFAALSAVLFRDISSHITPGLVGLSVSYALSVTQTLNLAVRMTSELETNIVAVERIKEYSEPKANEAAVDTPKEIHIPEEWPSKGEIHFENLALRYRPGLDLVLKGVTATINPREKIGIIGRTGAGKSSMTLALFRLVEPFSGQIVIDGLDIAKLKLHDLRSRLTIVPQDPVMFSGTLRDNLDPFSQHNDVDIWAALELTHPCEFVRSFPDKLDHKITEGGRNLSVGQRQLICLTRALLRKPKILILDEAAASVDIETDHLIQSTILSEFQECTVLTIAHRLHSVLNSDRLLVFKEGRIVEFDSPQNLFAKPDSLFRALAFNAGITNLNDHQTNSQPSIQSPK